MKTILAIAIFFLTNLSSLHSQTQILQQFPDNQVPYIGGYKAYYKDFHDIIIEKKLQPCTNSQEMYQLNVLITPDSEVKFIRDNNESVVQQNKCAYDLAREVAKYQKGWNPATIDGIKHNAVAIFLIFPDDIFNRYSDGYSPAFTAPIYNNYDKNHLENFRKELINKLDLKRFSWNDIFTVQTEFIITKEGKMKDIILTKKTGLEEFDRMIIYTFKEMRKKWKPATINGQPIDFRFKFTLRAITDPA